MSDVIDMLEFLERRNGRTDYIIQCGECGFTHRISLVNGYHRVEEIQCPKCELDGELYYAGEDYDRV